MKVKEDMLVLVTGYQHSGTTILRKLIGNEGTLGYVFEETGYKDMEKDLLKTGWIIKAPNFLETIMSPCRNHKDSDRVKIVSIIRHPLDCIASLKEREPETFKECLQNWTDIWCEAVKNSVDVSEWSNGYFIRYEDMFKNDYEELKKLFKWLDLEWTDEIVSKNKEIILYHSDIPVPTKEPDRKDHGAFRTWQVHQPLEQKSNRYKKVLTSEDIERIKKMPTRVKGLNFEELMKLVGYEV